MRRKSEEDDEMAEGSGSRDEVMENLSNIADDIQKEFGGKGKGLDRISNLGSKYEKVETFPTGCFELDDALDGGLPIGKIVEYFGAEATGKTSLCYHAVCEFQKKYPGVPIAWIDAERAFDASYMEQIGADPAKVIWLTPENGEMAFDMMTSLMDKGVKLIIVDSVTGLAPKEEADKTMNDAQKVGGHAAMMSRGVKRIVGEASKHKATIIFINQIRMKIGVSYGDNTTTTGGTALGFYASVRVQFKKVKVVKDACDDKDASVIDEARSVVSQAIVRKTRFCPPMRIANFAITFGIGVDHEWSVLNQAVEYGIVEEKGARYYYNEQQIGYGELSTVNMLRENRELYNELLEKTKEAKEKAKKEKEEEAARVRALRLS